MLIATVFLPERFSYAVIFQDNKSEDIAHRLIIWETRVIAVRASASLPLLSRNVKIGEEYYLDGALADSIPIKRAIADGNQKNVVILTKEVGFVRKPSSHIGLMRLKYKKYPKVYELMANRHNMYNDTLAFIKEEEKAGRAFVIRPETASNVGRIEKDRAKLEALYHIGYEDAKRQYESLMEFLES